MSFHLTLDPDALALGDPELGAPDPSRLISGQPQFKTWNLDTAFDESQWTGVWESSPGAWRVAYEEWEYCTILSGRGALIDDQGISLDLRAGVHFIIKPGFSGRFEVYETLRKIYIIRLPQA